MESTARPLPVPEAPAARKGRARKGQARQGEVRQGEARQGEARQGEVRQGQVRGKEALPSAKPLNVQPLPPWVTAVAQARKANTSPEPGAPARDGGDDAFAAGAALFALDRVLRAEPVFLGALRMRIALDAAVAASRLLHARSDEAELRDILHLARAGDEPGLAGRGHVLLRRFCERPARLAGAVLDEIGSLGGSDGLPEWLALLRADLAIAERLGWSRPLPLHLLAIHDPAFRRGEEGRRISIGEPGWEQVRHAVIARAAVHAHRRAFTLAGRAERLLAASGTLRTREAEAGLALILGDDCVAPWRMAVEGGAAPGKGMRSDRAARRFCQSLHAKGALRLLTPRPTFRLYGL